MNCGKQYFKDSCKNLGLNCDELFIIGESSSKGDRVVQHSTYLKRKNSHLFVICYRIPENLYIAWSLNIPRIKTKSYFSIKKSKLNTLENSDTVIPVIKNIEYPNVGKETVRIFNPEAVKKFLKTYVIPLMKGESENETSDK